MLFFGNLQQNAITELWAFYFCICFCTLGQRKTREISAEAVGNKPPENEEKLPEPSDSSKDVKVENEETKTEEKPNHDAEAKKVDENRFIVSHLCVSACLCDLFV